MTRLFHNHRKPATKQTTFISRAVVSIYSTIFLQFPPADNRKFVFDLRSFSAQFPDIIQMVLHVRNIIQRATRLSIQWPAIRCSLPKYQRRN